MNRILLLVCLLVVFCTSLVYASTVSNPVIMPAGGTYSSSQQVLLGCPTTGATIYYTTNGNDPTESDTGVPRGTYITISASCTLKAKAYLSGWDPSAVSSAVFTITGGTVATPTFSPDGGTYTGTQSVTISCSTSGATIRYTTDGSDPTTSSTQYTSAVSISSNTTLKSKAWKTGLTDSAIKTGTYVINTIVATPTFSPDGGTYYGTQSVTISCSTSGATIRYTTDGTDPTSSSTQYSSAVSVASSETLKARGFKTGLTDSAVKSGSYTILTQCATPTFTPDGGSYSSTQNVTMSCATPSAAIRYTTDGSTPTSSSTLYSSAVAISQDTTLKSIAIKSGLTDSTVKSALYSILVATPTYSPDGGTYSSTQSVTISCSTTGSAIRYTTDGSDPTTSSTQYTAPVSVSQPLTLKARAWKTGYTVSNAKSAAYSMYVATPTFSPDAGIYGGNQNITISCSTSGSTIYYTTDGTTPTTSSSVYSSPVAITQDCTVKAIAAKSSWTDSSVKSAAYDLRFSGTCVTPTFNYQTGNYNGPIGVTMSTTTTGAEIRYTIDGTDPTESSYLYDPDGVVVVGSSMTLKAKACKADYVPSATQAQTYTLITGGGGGTNPIYQQTITDTMPHNVSLWLSKIYEPNYMNLEWTGEHPNFETKRIVGGSDTSLGTTSNKTLTDQYAFTSGNTIAYAVRGLGGSDPDRGLPAPPDGADPNLIYTRRVWGASDWAQIDVCPVRVAATANSTVDSRLDLRRADNHLVDFQFNNSVYRGGLFAGYASDPSRVGRSFIKYTLSPPAQSEKIWAASVNTYYTRSAANGSTVVGAHVVDDSWSPSTIVWSNAPSITPADPVAQNTVTYNSSSPQSSWCNWSLGGIVAQEMYGDGSLSIGLASTNETSSNWAYFARNEYDQNYAPNVLYAYKAPNTIPLEIALDVSSVTGGNTIHGVVYVNYPAPVGGRSVSILTSDSHKAMVGTTIVPQGATSAEFVVSTAIVSQSAQVDVWADERKTITLHTITINH